MVSKGAFLEEVTSTPVMSPRLSGAGGLHQAVRPGDLPAPGQRAPSWAESLRAMPRTQCPLDPVVEVPHPSWARWLHRRDTGRVPCLMSELWPEHIRVQVRVTQAQRRGWRCLWPWSIMGPWPVERLPHLPQSRPAGPCPGSYGVTLWRGQSTGSPTRRPGPSRLSPRGRRWDVRHCQSRPSSGCKPPSQGTVAATAQGRARKWVWMGPPGRRAQLGRGAALLPVSPLS